MKNKFKVNGDITTIYLKRRNGLTIETKVSTSDLEKLQSYPNTWFSHWNEHTQSYYVYGNILGTNKKIRLHRWLLNVGNDKVVDHIDHDTLNNTRENLRLITREQNAQNKKGANKNSSSGVRGVTWSTHNKKWKASTRANNKQIHVGYFDDINVAEQAVIQARRKHLPFSVK